MKVYRYINFSDSFMNFGFNPDDAENAGYNMGSKIRNGLNNMGEAFGGVRDKMASAGRNFMGTIKGFGTGLKQGLDHYYDSAKNAVSGIPGKMQEMGSDLGQRFGNAADAFGQSKQVMMENMQNPMNSIKWGQQAVKEGTAQMKANEPGSAEYDAGKFAADRGRGRMNQGLMDAAGTAIKGTGNIIGNTTKAFFQKPGTVADNTEQYGGA